MAEIVLIWTCEHGTSIMEYCQACGDEEELADEYLRHLAGDDAVDNQQFDPGTPVQPELQRDDEIRDKILSRLGPVQTTQKKES